MDPSLISSTIQSFVTTSKITEEQASQLLQYYRFNHAVSEELYRGIGAAITRLEKLKLAKTNRVTLPILEQDDPAIQVTVKSEPIAPLPIQQQQPQPQPQQQQPQRMPEPTAPPASEVLTDPLRSAGGQADPARAHSKDNKALAVVPLSPTPIQEWSTAGSFEVYIVIATLAAICAFAHACWFVNQHDPVLWSKAREDLSSDRATYLDIVTNHHAEYAYCRTGNDQVGIDIWAALTVEQRNNTKSICRFMNTHPGATAAPTDNNIRAVYADLVIESLGGVADETSRATKQTIDRGFIPLVWSVFRHDTFRFEWNRWFESPITATDLFWALFWYLCAVYMLWMFLICSTIWMFNVTQTERFQSFARWSWKKVILQNLLVLCTFGVWFAVYVQSQHRRFNAW